MAVGVLELRHLAFQTVPIEANPCQRQWLLGLRLVDRHIHRAITRLQTQLHGC